MRGQRALQNILICEVRRGEVFKAAIFNSYLFHLWQSHGNSETTEQTAQGRPYKDNVLRNMCYGH